jgi:hypothetical protein
MAESTTSVSRRLVETEKYVEWVLANPDPEAVDFERARYRMMPPRELTRAELRELARGARAWALEFVMRVEMGKPLWLGGDPRRLLEIDFGEVDWTAVVLAFEAVKAERDWRTELREAVPARRSRARKDL